MVLGSFPVLQREKSIRWFSFIYLLLLSDLSVESSLDVNFICLICFILIEFFKLQRIITATLLTDALLGNLRLSLRHKSFPCRDYVRRHAGLLALLL